MTFQYTSIVSAVIVADWKLSGSFEFVGFHSPVRSTGSGASSASSGGENCEPGFVSVDAAGAEQETVPNPRSASESRT